MKKQTYSSFEKTLKNKEILKKYGIDRVGVFGSFARGEKYNDIDLFIEDDRVPPQNLIALKNELEREFGTKIDIMTKKYANPIVLHRARKDMRYVGESEE